MKLPASMKDNLGMMKVRYWLLSGLLILLAVVALTGAAVYGTSSYECHQDELHYRKHTHYNLFAGCYIEIEAGVMVKSEQLNAFKSAR